MSGQRKAPAQAQGPDRETQRENRLRLIVREELKAADSSTDIILHMGSHVNEQTEALSKKLDSLLDVVKPISDFNHGRIRGIDNLAKLEQSFGDKPLPVIGVGAVRRFGKRVFGLHEIVHLLTSLLLLGALIVALTAREKTTQEVAA